MKINTECLAALAEHEPVPGNVYPAQGGRKCPGTAYWLVVGVSKTGAHCIGFTPEGDVASATTYLKGALRQRPVIGRVDVGAIQLGVLK